MILGKRVRKKTKIMNAISFRGYVPDLAFCMSMHKQELKKKSRCPHGKYKDEFCGQVDKKSQINTAIAATAKNVLGKEKKDLVGVYLEGQNLCSTKTFVDYGLDPANLVAVSTDVEVEKSIQKYNNTKKKKQMVQYVGEEICSYFRESGKKNVDFVYLDVCSTWLGNAKGFPVLDLIKNSLAVLNSPAILAFSFCRRENKGYGGFNPEDIKKIITNDFAKKVVFDEADTAGDSKSVSYKVDMKCNDVMKNKNGTYFVFIYEMAYKTV